MKTKKIFPMLSLLLIFIGMTNFLTNANANKGGYPWPIPDKKMISYDVNIVHQGLNDVDLIGYSVVITDGKGRNIAPPQKFVPGNWEYIFTETGPADGVRTAMFIKAPHTGGPNVHFRNSSIHGPFQCGLKYSIFIEQETLSDGSANEIR